MDEHHSVLVAYPDENKEGGFGRVVEIHSTAVAEQIAKGFVVVERQDDGSVKAVDQGPAPRKPKTATDEKGEN